MADFNLPNYIRWIEDEVRNGSSRFNLFSIDYVKSHERRFARTIDLLNRCNGQSAVEIGATDFFQVYLSAVGGYSDIWSTLFSPHIYEKFYRKHFSACGRSVESQVVSLNLESEMFPVDAGRFDLVLFCEVLEHLDIDPMFCLIEINRIMKDGGQLILTTPNSCSARIAYKACLGYRPHFFMQYEKSRSPYRHNFEHDVHTVADLLNAAGFTIEILQTHDVFEDSNPEALEFLRRNKMPMEHRGDDIMVLARKTGQPTDRWPASIYTG